MSEPILGDPLPEQCGRCGSKYLVAETVRKAFTEGNRIVVVEGIPAVVCRSCGAHYHGRSTEIAINLLRGEGFPSEQASGSITVPVFRFGDHTAKA